MCRRTKLQDLLLEKETFLVILFSNATFLSIVRCISKMNTEEEKALVEEAKTDINSFGRLYEQYYQPIFGYILRRTADIQISEDITSNVFYKALNNIRKFTWKGISFSAWLFRITNNEIINYYRNNGHKQLDNGSISNSIHYSEPSPETEIIHAEEELKKHQEFLLMNTLVKQLPALYQEVITLRYFEKKKLSEVAEILGKREGTVKSLLHRGLEKLRFLMQDKGEMP